MKVKYEVWTWPGRAKGEGKAWVRPLRAVEVLRGHLHAEFRDGTNGIYKPEEWRKVEPKGGTK